MCSRRDHLLSRVFYPLKTKSCINVFELEKRGQKIMFRLGLLIVVYAAMI